MPAIAPFSDRRLIGTDALACQACGGTELVPLYTAESIPAHSVLQMYTREAALEYRTADLSLVLCTSCGFIFNALFDPSANEYSEHYEETQGYSETFNSFHRNLARVLIDRYNLRGRRVVEIGCGKGEFLLLLCRMGENEGIGIDPAYVDGRLDLTDSDRVRFIRELYSETFARLQADFICCKMTLEHISATRTFVETVRRSLDECSKTIVFFQVPNVKRILSDFAFWDIYYEHCSYFSPGSLARLFRSCGFDVATLSTSYDDQYIAIEARASSERESAPSPGEEHVEELRDLADRFTKHVPHQIELWGALLTSALGRGLRTVLWGGGSKAVAFLHAVDKLRAVEYVVDINPHRQGTFLPGTGQKIVAPEFLREYSPDIVIAMNPIYEQEILNQLTALGIAPSLLTAKIIDESFLRSVTGSSCHATPQWRLQGA